MLTQQTCLCWANVGPMYTLRWYNVAHQLWTNVVLLIGPTEVTPTICQRSANVEPALDQRKSVGLCHYVEPPMSDANKFCSWLGVVLRPLQYRIDTLYKVRHVSSTFNFNAHHSVVQSFQYCAFLSPGLESCTASRQCPFSFLKYSNRCRSNGPT